MQYNIVLRAENTFIFIKKIYKIFYLLWGWGWAGIPESVGDGDEIRFLILVGYG